MINRRSRALWIIVTSKATTQRFRFTKSVEDQGRTSRARWITRHRELRRRSRPPRIFGQSSFPGSRATLIDAIDQKLGNSSAFPRANYVCGFPLGLCHPPWISFRRGPERCAAQERDAKLRSFLKVRWTAWSYYKSDISRGINPSSFGFFSIFSFVNCAGVVWMPARRDEASR